MISFSVNSSAVTQSQRSKEKRFQSPAGVRNWPLGICVTLEKPLLGLLEDSQLLGRPRHHWGVCTPQTEVSHPFQIPSSGPGFSLPAASPFPWRMGELWLKRAFPFLVFPFGLPWTRGRIKDSEITREKTEKLLPRGTLVDTSSGWVVVKALCRHCGD